MVNELTLRGGIQFTTIAVQLGHIRELQEERDDLRAKLAEQEADYEKSRKLLWDQTKELEAKIDDLRHAALERGER